MSKETARGRAINYWLKKHSEKPLNYNPAPIHIGYFEAGFEAGERFARRSAVSHPEPTEEAK